MRYPVLRNKSFAERLIHEITDTTIQAYCWTDDQVWELCLLNVALEPLYIHKEGVVDYVVDRVNG